MFPGFSIEAGTQRLVAAYFGICSCLLCMLFYSFLSLVYGPSVCHSCLFKVEQMPISNPIEWEPCVLLHLWAKPPFVYLIKEETWRLCLNHVKPVTSGPVNLVFFCLTGLFECEHPFIDKAMVVTEPAVVSTGLLGLSSKLHPGDKSRMLNKDITSFMHSLSWVPQNWASEEKALLAGWFNYWVCSFLFWI